MQDRARQLAERLERLAPDKRAALEATLAREGVDTWALPIVHVARAAGAPARPSSGQEWLWRLHGLDPQATHYNLTAALRVRGTLDPVVLQRVVDAIVARHEVFRSTFDEDDDGVRVHVAASAAVAVELVDVARDSAPPSAERAREVAHDLAARPFDLRTGPLLRVSVLRLGEADQLVLLAMHHVASDAWSMTLLVREVGVLYAAFAAGRSSPLPPPAIQYGDFARWQRRWLDGAAAARDLEWWRSQLAGASRDLGLVSDRARPARPSFAGAHVDGELPPGLVSDLRALARREVVTVYMVLLAALKLVLFRRGGCADPSVGSSIARRPRSETEDVVGFFVNTLVMRTDLGGAPSGRELLARVRDGVLAAIAHQDVPFERVVEAVHAARGGERAPLFQVFFVLQNAPAAAIELPGLSIEPVAVETTHARFDLTVRAVERVDGAIALDLEYATDLFPRATAERLMDQLGLAVRELVARPDASVAVLDVVGVEQRAQLLALGCRAGDEAARPASVWARVAAHAATRADARAVVDESGRALGYGALRDAASRVARALHAAGATPGDLVAIECERGVALVAAMLGAWGAGCAYVVLDPEQPAERLRGMLDDAAARLVLSDRPAGSVAAERAGTQLLDLASLLAASSDADADADAGRAARAGEHPADGFAGLGDVDPDAVAYVIYTSGSTGRPKGVAVSHGALGEYVASVSEELGLSGGKRFLALTTAGADLGHTSVFGSLATGGELHVLGAASSVDGELVAAVVERAGIEVMKLTPSHLRVLQGGVDDPARVLPGECLVLGGEVLPSRVVAEIGALRPDLRVVNHYGPTETTVGVVVNDLGRTSEGASGDAERVALGVPLPHVRAYVVDAVGQLAAEGVAGELWIGGASVAQGYVGRPAETASRFVPDPWSTARGARVYRTGDRAMWRDGKLEFLGRIDGQLALHGQRMEPEEIELAIEAQAGVIEAAVREWDGRLVGYVVVEAGSEGRTEEYRVALRERLPEAMIPVQWEELESLPVTANGKLDRRALPEPGARERRASEYEAPRGEVEEVLARIWGEVLRLERVGRGESFFALGGDSIQSLQVVTRARRAGWKVTPKQVFERPTVAELAQVAERWGGTEDRSRAEGAGYLTPIQEWFFAAGHAAASHWNQGFLFEVPCELRTDRVRAAVRKVVAQHDALRLRFERGPDGRVRQRYADDEHGEDLVWAVDLADAARDAVVQRAAIEAECERAQRSLDIERGPVLRVVHMTLGAGRPGRVLLVAHHLVVDGVSWRILLEDVERVLVEGEGADLGGKTTSYVRWAERLREYAGSPEVSEQLAYWRDHPAWALPHDAIAPARPIRGDAQQANTVASTDVVEASLDEAETRRLHEDAPGAYRTRADELLLAALARVLGEWSGTPQVRVELEGHGRDDLFADADVSRTVGWFTVRRPVVLAAGGDDPGEHLLAVKEAVRAAPRHGIAWGLLRYASASRDALAAGTEAPVAYNNLGRLDGVLGGHADGLRLAAEGAGTMRSPASLRRQEIDVVVHVAGGCLRMAWTYSRALQRRVTIERLARATIAQVRALIAHCTAPGACGVSPADFPLARLSAEELARVVPDGAAGSIEDVYPLSPMQEGMLFHSVAAPGSGVYVNQLRGELGGGIDEQAFARAWQRLVARHAILRTRFAWQGLTRPQQIVERAGGSATGLVIEDWRDVAPSPQRLEDLWQARCASEQARGFDLERLPLMHMLLARTAAGTHRFCWSRHHVLLDGWCTSRLLEELVQAYAAESSGSPLELPETRPFRDHIAWLAERADRTLARSVWRARLDGVARTAILGRPHETGDESRARPATPGGVHTERVVLDAGTTQRLERLARSENVTLSTVVQAAWALVLSRSAGTRDVTFGVTVAGRPADLAGAGEMLGLFINTLPLRLDVRAAATLGAWLREVQARGVELREWEHVPLWEVQRWAGVAPGERLFDSIVVYENYPVDAAIGRGATTLGARAIERRERTSYPLTLVVAPGRTLAIELDADTASLDATHAAALASRLRSVLGELAAGGARHVGALAALPPDEEGRVLRAWNATSTGYGAFVAVHEEIVACAAAAPDAIAVELDAACLTYAELERGSAAVARALRARGVGPESRVGLLLERSLELVVALVGVLRAGAAYVPIEADWPAERIADVTADARVELILTHAALCMQVPPDAAPALDVVALLRLDAAAAADASSPPLPHVHPENLAYVIYTSGSTGRPKGAGITHAGLRNRLAWMQQEYGLARGEGVLQKTPYGFDVSVWEFLWPLRAGARLVVARPGAHRDPRALADAIRRHAVSTVHFVPAMLGEFVASGELPRCPSLRRVIASGEALHGDLVADFHATGTGATLHNLYGPTEATVDVTSWRCTAGELAAPPIGRPIANVETYVLDASMAPSPVGAEGELYLGGVQLARGYLGRAALTAERFVPHPWSRTPGERLYRTGDVVRWRADGALEYVGRRDAQVKLRGQRIELGEIEAALLGVDGVAQAAVLLRADAPGAPRLVAYVAGARAPAVAIDPEERLRARLRDRLPAYMVPAAFVFLDRLPLTGSGKIDRRALPAPQQPRVAPAAERDAPRTASERALATIWQQVLGAERIARDADFFALGGDSILALRVVSRARAHDLELAPRDLFEHPTLAALARVARPARPLREEDQHVAGEILPTPIQRWLLSSDEPALDRWNQALLLDVPPQLDVVRLRAAVDALLRHHDALRLRFARDREPARAAYAAHESADVLWTLDLADVPEAEHRRRIEEACERAQGSLDVVRGPLLRVVYVARGAARGRLLLTAHHLAVDGVSWRILLEDLTTLLGGGALPAKGASLQRFTAALDAWSRSPELAQQLGWWRERPAFALPCDRHAGANDVASAAAVETILDRASTAALLADVPDAYRTRLDEAVLSAVAGVLARWSGSPHVVIDLEGHGREAVLPDLDLSRTVGWLTALHPVVLDGVESDPGARLAGVKQRLRAVPAGGLGWGVLRWMSPHAGALAALPPVPVLYNDLGRLDGELPDGIAPAPESPGEMRAPSSPRAHLLEIRAHLRDGRLHLRWTYGRNRHDETTVRRLADETVAGLLALIEHCRDPRAGRLSAVDLPLAGLDDAEVAALALDPRAVEDVYPATAVQAGMLFHSQLAPESDAYFERLGGVLHAPIDAHAFVGAWQDAARTHAVLRTSFALEAPRGPLQIVRRASAGTLPVHVGDLAAMTPDEQALQLERWLRADRERGCAPGAPAIRVALFALDVERHAFVLSFHHALLDGWSVALLLRDVLGRYAERTGGGVAAPLAARPFRDHVRWLRDAACDDDERFWRRVLAGHEPQRLARAVLDADPAATRPHAERRHDLDPDGAAALERLARGSGVTPSTLVQAAWALVLARRLGTRDVVLGVTTSGRPPELDGAEEMIGLFINTLPLRVRVRPELDVRGWLRELQAAGVEMRRHEHTPLARVQAWSGVAAGTPLFESIVVFENYPVDAALRGGAGTIAVSPLPLPERGSGESLATRRNHYPLTLVAQPGAGLRLIVAHDRRAVGDAAAAALLDDVVRVLRWLPGHADERLGALAIASERQTSRALALGTDARRRDDAVRSVWQRFLDHAAATPDARALVAEDGSALSYGALRSCAEHVAATLRATGVTRGDVVAIEAERGLALIAAMHGVWAAGCAYVVLDPEQPVTRVRAMLADSGARVVLSDRVARSSHEGQNGVRVLDLRGVLLGAAPPATDERRDGFEILGDVDPDAVAYVIYTSGSTGRPKGVAVSHGALGEYVASVSEELGLCGGKRFLSLTTAGADLGHTSVFGSLATGGELHVLGAASSVDGEVVAAVVERAGIEVMKLTPSHLRVLQGGVDDPARVLPGECLVLGGEVLPSRVVAEIGALRPDLRVVNHYGPTETTVGVVVNDLGRTSEGASGDAERVALGVPLPHVRAYVVDAVGQLAAEGVAGELWIGGASVAQGYVGRPAETASRFVPDPWSAARGARVYRTGDRAMWRAGKLEFLGRIDGQLALHGQRMEPEEIELAIEAQAGVIEAAVREWDGRLVGYVVVESGHEGRTEEYRVALRERLPDAMIPVQWEELESLPVTANGKLDRRALPEPGARERRASEYEAPRGEVEEVLARIWGEVLRLERVGRGESFFALGGDSIQSLQVVTRARRAGWKVTPKQVFERPTVAELAQVAERWGGTEDRSRAAGAGYLTPIQEWFFAAGHAAASHWNQGFLFEVPCELRTDRVRALVRKVVAQHDALRLRFERGTDGRVRQRYADEEHGEDLLWAVDLADAASDAEQQRALIEAECERAQRSLDIERGPVLRVVHMTLGADRPGRVLLVAHHLVVDGVSWRILLEDVERVLVEGEGADLGGKTTSYVRWAERLREYAGSPEVSEQLAYWREGPAWALPHDGAHESVDGGPAGADDHASSARDASNTVGSAAVVVATLDEDETRALLDATAGAAPQLDDLLLTALASVLGGWTRAPRVVIEIEGHGREELFPDVDVTRTIGWFTARHPLVLEAPVRGADAEHRIAATRASVRAVPGRGLGWGVLRFLRAHDARLARRAGAPVAYNNLGRLDGVLRDTAVGLRLAAERPGTMRSPASLRRQELDVVVHVSGGRLHVGWTFSRALHRQATIERLSGAMLEELRALVAELGRAPRAPQPRDDARRAALDGELSAAELDELLSEIDLGVGEEP